MDFKLYFDKMNYFNKIVIGTAQFGLNYGINNQTKFNFSEKEQILHKAFDLGVRTIDTAISYGNSEKVLGQIGISNWNTITKLPTFKETKYEKSEWVKKEIHNSLKRLNINQFEGVLFHNPDELKIKENINLYHGLRKLQEEGLIKKIGFSIYNIEQAEFLLKKFDFEILQVPYNVFDRRFDNEKINNELKAKKIELHARSIFLQGLLLMELNKIPENFKFWKNLFLDWNKFLLDSNTNALDACIALTLNNKNFSKVLIGVDNLIQIEEIASSVKNVKQLYLPENLSTNDINLINPQNWKKYE
jgi:hypothetical protein